MTMKTYIKTFTVAFLSLAAATLKSDVFTNSYTVSQLSNKSAIYELVSQMLVGPGVSVRPGGSLFDPTTSSQVGFFSNLVARVAPTFTNGVILSTGLARTGNVTTNFWSGTTLENEGINTNPYAEAGSDDDLYTYFKKSGELTGYDDALYDPAGIILYIQPTNKTINIPFVLASEEFNYFDWYDDNQPKEGHVNVVDLPTLDNYRDQSDKFAFFLQEIGPNAEFDDGEITNDDISCMTNNIARFPDGGNIGIASVNPHTNTNYFVSNVVICKGVDMWGDEYEYLNFPTNDLSLPMEFNGAIVGLVAVAKNLDTNKIYKLKIMLADHNNNAYTSALFLRDRGITSGAELKIDVTGPAYLPEPGPVTFTNTVSSDRWAAPADNVVVTNYLPAGVQKSMLTEPWCSAGEIDSGSWDKIDETGYFVWRIGSDFAAGSNAVMTIDCNLTDLGAGVYTNLATVAASDGDYDWSNNTDKCVTRVGNVKPLLTIAAITTNKVQGTEMVLPALQFVASAIDDAGVSYQVSDIVKEIGVTFTKKGTTDVAYPTNAVDDAVGEYDIHLTNVTLFDEDAFSEVTCEPGLLTVDQARHLHVYAIDTNKVYGAEFPLSSLEFVATIDGTNETERVEGITVTFTDDDGNPVNPVTAPVGSYQIVLSDIQGFDTNAFASVTYHPGVLTIDKKPLEITINPQQKPYGEWFDFTAPGIYWVSGGQLVNGDAIKRIDFTCGGESPEKGYEKNGYPITADPEDVIGGNDESLAVNYDITVNPGVLYIIPFPITITANDVTNCYGEVSTFDGTEFTVAPAELPNGETVQKVTLTNLLATTTPVADVPYESAIHPSHVVTGINTNNYKITFVDGKLTITQAVLTITANSKTRPYGTTIPVLGTDFSTQPTELPNGETVDEVTITCPEAGQWDEPIGTYSIVPSHDVTGSLDTNNYNIVFVNGTLEVTPTEFTATPEPVTKYYDGTPTNIVVKLEGLPELVTPTFEYSYAENEGYVSASAFTGPTNVAERAIEVWCRAIAPGTTNTVHATVTILPRVVVEQADSAERAYNGKPLTNAVHFFEGAAASNLAKSVYFDLARSDIYAGPARPDWADAVGFFNPDGIVTAPMTAASTITDPGTQPNAIDPDAVTFTASTKTSNYLISYLDGTLTVTLSDALTLEVSDVEKFYDAEPTNVAYVAKVGGTPIADATVRLHERGTANWVLAADFEPYLDTTNVIVDVAVAKHGYVAVTNSATLLIKPRLVTLIAATDEKTYDGTPLTNWTFDVKADTTLGHGFVKEEGVARVEMTPESTITDLGTVDNVIATEIAKPGTKLDRNYVVSTENGTLTVNPLGTLTVEASSVEKFYDAEPTNVTWATKLDGTPIGDATVFMREKGEVTWIASSSFEPYLDTTNVTVEVKAVKRGCVDATAEATVKIKPRPVTLIAGSASKSYDGTPLTNWTFAVKVDTTTPGYGFVTEKGEGVERVEMTPESAITIPGSVANVIAREIAKAGTDLARNYVVTTENGMLTVTASNLLTVEAFPVEKFYDGALTNIAYVAKVDGVPVADATISLREKGLEAWVPAADFAPYLNAANVTVEVKATKTGYADATAEASVTIKPRIVVHHARDGEWVYDGDTHTQGECFEDVDEEAKLSKAKWGSEVVLPESTGFVDGEGYAADLVMTADSKIVYPGTQPNVIDQAADKTALASNTRPENYELHYLDGSLKVTPAELTITVNDAVWKVGKPRPAYSFADFSAQLKPGDTVADVTGGSGRTTDVTYTNRVWASSEPTKEDKGKRYPDEIWIDVSRLSGASAANYTIAVVPGALSIVSPDTRLTTTVAARLNWDTGLLNFELTVKNVGEDEVDPDYNYWVELTPGPAGTGDGVSVARTYYLDSPTGTLPSGADYLDLTAAVKEALASAGGDEVFDPGEEITVKNVNVYHWKRWSPDKFIDTAAFFRTGLLSEQTEPKQQSLTPVQSVAVVTSVAEKPSRSCLANDGASPVETSLANVYDGVLYDADALAGTIRVQLVKANKKTGLSKLTATLAPVGGKKVTLSGNFDPNAASFVATVKKDGRTLVLSIGKDGLSGTFDGLVIDGARNRYSSKDAEDKAVVASADGLIGSYALANPCENGWETYVVKIAKKGKVTIAGTLADGSSVSASAQMIIGAMGCSVPVIVSKKSVSRAFCIWFGEDRIGIDGLDEAVIGQVGNLAAAGTLRFNADSLLSLLESDTVAVLSDYLPYGAEILPNGKKWVVMPDMAGKALKTGSLVWDRENGVVNAEKSKVDGYNVSGLKLTYTAKTGVFKGSFKVYEVVKGALKTVTAKVTGIVVDGVGYGTAKFGKSGTIGLLIE